MEEKHLKKHPYCTAKYVLFSVLFATLVFLVAFIATSFQTPCSNAEQTNIEKTSKFPTIIIDAGHGGEDGGTSGAGVLEKDLNLLVSRDLADMLRGAGFDVVMTRDDDRLLYDPNIDYKGRKKQLDLAERLRIGESFDDAIFISIHMNSFPDSKYRGLQVYFSPNDPASRELAECIQSSVCENFQIDNKRAVKQATSRIFILNQISKPAVLVECAFLSNPEECRLISTEEYRKKLTFCIFSGVCGFISENSY